MNLDLIRSGDAQAFDELVEVLWSPLCDYLVSRLGARDLAEDAAQEAFVRLWEKRERWEDVSARALVFRIGWNVASDLARRSSVRERYVADAAPRPTASPSPEDDAMAAELQARVAHAVAQLPERRRQIFEMVRYAGLSYREVAEALGLSEQTVANHLSLALRDLRVELHDLIESDDGVDSGVNSNDG